MRILHRLAAVVAVFLVAAALLAPPAFAFEPPGLSGDAQRYSRDIRRAAPAGGTPQARAEAERRANEAAQRNDWPAAIAAQEQRLALGAATDPAAWLALSEAWTRRNPPDLNRALQAAWLAYESAPAGPPEIPAFLRLAELLRRMDRVGQAIPMLEQALERAPDNAQYRARLAELRREAGVAVTNISTDPESDPARACVKFVSPLPGSARLADYVRVTPAAPVTVEVSEGALCVAGLPHGALSRVTLVAGLPGADGARLGGDVTLEIRMPDRAATVALDSSAFILPRGQGAAVTVSTVNLSAVALKLVRVGERGLAPQIAGGRIGRGFSPWAAERIAAGEGRLIWQGTLSVPQWERNRTARTRLDLAPLLAGQGAGVFALVATPGDGTPFDAWDATTGQWIVVTDLALTSFRGRDGLTVLARSLETAAPVPGATLSLVARNNDILAEATTDATGTARFPAPLLAGRGGAAPLSLHAVAPGNDFAFLDLTTASFDLSDRGAEGRTHPGPLDAWAWTERGIFRPGETVHVSVLVRSDAGDASDVPVTLRVRRPNGTIFHESVPPRSEGHITLPLVLPAAAPQGGWVVEVLADRAALPIGTTGFRVEDFVPERVAVSIADPGRPLVPGTPLPLSVTARYLFGPPAPGLTGTAEVVVTPDPEPFAHLRGWRFGTVDDTTGPLRFELPVAPTDAQGATTLALDLPRVPDSTAPLKATVSLALAEPGARPSRASITVPVRSAGVLLGLRPLFTGGAVNDGAEAAFELAAFDAAGQPVAAPNLRLRIVRERPDFRFVIRERTARYETVWRDEPQSERALSLNAAAPERVVFPASWGRWRVEAFDPNGLAAVSFRFRAGWIAAGSAEVPDRLDVAADKASYAAGEVARVRITPPFAGQATLAVVTDRVRALSVHDVPAGGATIDLPVDAAWGPGAYVAVLLHRPRAGLTQATPLRAVGLAWLGLDPALRRLDLSIAPPPPARPRTRLEVPVRVGNAAADTRVVLAAVDEGILRLTQHNSPDPASWFAGRRNFGADLRDDYGRLIAPAEGPLGATRSGGGDDIAGAGLPVVPLRIVSILLPPQPVGADGVARFALDLPDFDGELRLMAFAFDARRTGGAAVPLTVRDRVVVDPTIPRFLAPGDSARLSVALQSIDLPAGPVSLAITTEGPLEISGDLPATPTLTQGQRVRVQPTLRATGAGVGAITFRVTGPENFAATHRYEIAVRPPRGVVTELSSRQLTPGATLDLAPALLANLLPGATLTATAGSVARFDASALMRALDAWAYGCLEQSVSRGLPLTLTTDESLIGERRAERLQQSVAQVLDKQRFDGWFGLWSGYGQPEAWASAYAVEFLLRARAAGSTVPDAPLESALRALAESITDMPGADNALAWAEQAYAHYVLALAGRARPGGLRVIADSHAARLPTPLARAQLAAALVRVGDVARARTLFEAALAQPARQPWWQDFGSAQRDAAALVVLLSESSQFTDRIPALLDRLPPNEATPRFLSTQEMAWAVSAAAVTGRDGRPVSLALGGRALAPAPRVSLPVTPPASLRNVGAEPVWVSLAATGIPRNPLAAGRDGMRVTRRFFNRDGTPTNLDTVRQNDTFFVQLEGRAETNQPHRALVAHLLPAGWEIEPLRLGVGTPEAFPFLGELSEPVAVASRDDRFAAAIDLASDAQEFRLAFMVRAVGVGSFVLPGAELTDMYRPRFFARQAEGRITIQE